MWRHVTIFFNTSQPSPPKLCCALPLPKAAFLSAMPLKARLGFVRASPCLRVQSIPMMFTSARVSLLPL